MKVESKFMIDGCVVDLVMETHGVKFYQNEIDDTIFLCKGDTVFSVIELIPYCGEGGGGHFEIKSLNGDAK